MREIKFRAWDMEHGMSKPFFVTTLRVRWFWADGEVRHACDVSGLDSDNPLMQYTGLKDKNGVEIYEGDILQYWMDAQCQFPKAVRWEDGGFGVEGFQYPFRHFHFLVLTDYAVIGNVFENPELIK